MTCPNRHLLAITSYASSDDVARLALGAGEPLDILPGDCTNSLGAYFRFDELLQDYTGHGNTLTAHGATQGTGKIGNGASFTHSLGQYLSAPNGTYTAPPGSFTVAIWTKPAAMTFGYAIANSDENIDDGNGRGFWIAWQSDAGLGRHSVVKFGILPSVNLDGGGLLLIENVLASSWHLVVCSYNATTKEMRMRIDNGIPLVSPGSEQPSGYTASSQELYIGSAPTDSGHEFNGSLDEIVIANRVWNEAEEEAFWNDGNGVILDV